MLTNSVAISALSLMNKTEVNFVEFSDSAHDENVIGNIMRTLKSRKPKRSYLDVCRSTCKRYLSENDTRNTVFHQHPTLLLKLRDVAKACHSRKI